MVTATLSYKIAKIKFYIAVPKTPLDNQLQYKSHIVRNSSLSRPNKPDQLKTVWTPTVTTTRLTDENQEAKQPE